MHCFKVQVNKTDAVAAVLPLQDHWLPLSNLDLLLPPVDVAVFFCYSAAGSPFDRTLAVLKKALAQTLVSYYPFAGRLVKNAAGEPEIFCNNSGVDFVEAAADVDLRDLDLHNPDDSVEGKLVPARKHASILAVQVTRLQCGGVVVACTFAHQVADAYSANMFLVSWAEMARHEPPSRWPCFRRSLLLPRRPGVYDSAVDGMYIPTSSLPPPENQSDDQAAARSRIYYITAERINKLQSQANSENSGRRTKLEAFSAFLWKIVASGDHRYRLGIVVDGRSRLIGDDCNNAKLIPSLFGNVLSIPFGEIQAHELKSKSLNWIANRVNEFLQPALTKEHFLGLIDWMEERRPAAAVSRIYAGEATEAERAVVVSSGQHFPVGKMDYGWGPPVFGSYHFPWGGKSGYVMPMQSPKGNGDWVVYVHLVQAQLDLIETNAAHVFTPLTSDYLF